ncbi:MAG: PEGA domain-containing protein [Bradymonadia bacterium]
MTHERLEARLRVLDMQWDSVGEHLDEAALLEIVGGRAPEPHEAAHLASCDECTELLIVLGVGLEALAADIPEAAAMVPLGNAETPVEPLTEAPLEHAAGQTPESPPVSGGKLLYLPRPVKWLMMVAIVAGVAFAGHSTLSPSATVQNLATATRDLPTLEAAPAPSTQIAPVQLAPVQLAPVQLATAPARPLRPVEEVASLPHPPVPRVKRSLALPPLSQRSGVEDLTPAPPSGWSPPPAVETPKVIAEVQAPRRRIRRARRVAPDVVEDTPFRRPGPSAPISGRPRAFGQLQLISKPPSRVYIDGRDRGWTPIVNLRLPEGPHDIRLVYSHPRARQAEETFRVVIPPDKTWRISRDNLGPARGGVGP